MVDWISLSIAILSIIIAIVAIVLSFVISGPAGPTGTNGTNGTTGPSGTSTPIGYGSFSSKASVSNTIKSQTESLFNIVTTADGTPKNLSIDANGIITVNTGSTTLLTITGSNAIFPSNATIADMNFMTILTITNGTTVNGISNTNTYNISGYGYNTFLSSAFSWSGVVATGATIKLQTGILAVCPTGTGSVTVANPPTYINVLCFSP